MHHANTRGDSDQSATSRLFSWYTLARDKHVFLLVGITILAACHGASTACQLPASVIPHSKSQTMLKQPQFIPRTITISSRWVFGQPIRSYTPLFPILIPIAYQSLASPESPHVYVDLIYASSSITLSDDVLDCSLALEALDGFLIHTPVYTNIIFPQLPVARI